jgi:hypothetical protein
MKTDIEYAALVMGDDLIFYDGDLYRCGIDDSPDTWQPLESDGDSRRLEAACMKWVAENSYVVSRDEMLLDCLSMRSKAYDSGDLQAIREADYLLAVAIGKVIDGGSDAQS